MGQMDLRFTSVICIKNTAFFSKSQFGGGSVVVWTVFVTGGTSEFVFVENKMNLALYQDMLANSLLAVAPLITSEDWTFLQDNGSVPISCFTKSWMKANEVKTLQWPCRSPDLNPMENIGAFWFEIFTRMGDITEASLI
ncbi:hypothetical protein AVEN_165893-1 [Araneus ventricosus]|uniref:Tc1-like transposase DDE domain-containing protein n=1 Tax=Araneus ventricosus TaxID=182803 RepID=A0A4Y2JBJ3_ARAVE|nr:hypothetical protein AVEN_165893-1 [Araneus ventricosus]